VSGAAQYELVKGSDPDIPDDGSNYLDVRPITQKRAFDFVALEHRHHERPVGALFVLGLFRGAAVVGVAVVGRPVARKSDDGFTAEVTRLCTDGSRNACSMLYGRAARIAAALGYRRLITYTLASEPGSSLLASGFTRIGDTPGRSWSRPSRPRRDKHPLGGKVRWERCL
jgi:hypothetical protein